MDTKLEYFYIIRHISSGKFYAGSQYAKGCHPSNLMNTQVKRPYFTSSTVIKQLIESDGVDSFEIVEVIPRPLNDARQYESAFLTSFNAAKHDNWLNKSNGSENFYMTPEQAEKMKGRKFSDEHRANLSLVRLNQSSETRAKISASLKGRKQSDETRLKRSRSHTGKVGKLHTEETKRKQSESHKNMTDDTKQKMKEAWLSRTSLECPHCHMTSVNHANMKRWHFDNCRSKFRLYK